MSKFDISYTYERVKKLYYSVISYDYDLPIILYFFSKYFNKHKKECQVLDVGCGYGKKLIALHQTGYQVLGVDVNPYIVEANQKQDLACITVEDFFQLTEEFDVILMSHIIEHFNPTDLKDFMDAYLDRLKVGGYLIIATPLLTDYFYDDFDHIKPYSPVAIMNVFGKTAFQVQYYSRNKLSLTDLKFRKRHYKFTFVRGKYVRSATTKFYQVIEFISTLLCLVSLGFLAKKMAGLGFLEKFKSRDAQGRVSRFITHAMSQLSKWYFAALTPYSPFFY